MRTTYICPECRLRCYTGTPHTCGPDSLAHAPKWPTPRLAARDALRIAMTGPTSGGVAHQLAPVVLDAIILGQIPGVVWRPQ
jgi:hypothetical protein